MWLGASADKALPQPTPRTFRHRRRRLDAVLLHQATEKRKETRRGGGRSYGYECRPCAARTSSWPSPRSQVQPLRAILRNDTSSSQQYPAGVPGAPPGGATTPSSAAKSTDLTAATRSMRRQQKRKGEDAPRWAGGAGATELGQEGDQRSKRSPRGACRRVSSRANVPPRRARPRRPCPFSRCAPGAAGAGWSRSSAPAPL